MSPSYKEYFDKTLSLISQLPILGDEKKMSMMDMHDQTLHWDVIYKKMLEFLTKCLYDAQSLKKIYEQASAKPTIQSIAPQETSTPQESIYQPWTNKPYTFTSSNQAYQTTLPSVVSSAVTKTTNSLQQQQQQQQLSSEIKLQYCRVSGESTSAKMSCKSKSKSKNQNLSEDNFDLKGLESYFPRGYHLTSEQEQERKQFSRSVSEQQFHRGQSVQHKQNNLKRSSSYQQIADPNSIIHSTPQQNVDLHSFSSIIDQKEEYSQQTHSCNYYQYDFYENSNQVTASIPQQQQQKQSCKNEQQQGFLPNYSCSTFNPSESPATSILMSTTRSNSTFSVTTSMQVISVVTPPLHQNHSFPGLQITPPPTKVKVSPHSFGSRNQQPPNTSNTKVKKGPNILSVTSFLNQSPQKSDHLNHLHSEPSISSFEVSKAKLLPTTSTTSNSTEFSHGVISDGNNTNSEFMQSSSNNADLLQQISRTDYLESLMDNLNSVETKQSLSSDNNTSFLESSLTEDDANLESSHESSQEFNHETCDSDVQQTYNEMVKQFILYRTKSIVQKKRRKRSSVIKKSPVSEKISIANGKTETAKTQLDTTIIAQPPVSLGKTVINRVNADYQQLSVIQQTLDYQFTQSLDYSKTLDSYQSSSETSRLLARQSTLKSPDRRVVKPISKARVVYKRFNSQLKVLVCTDLEEHRWRTFYGGKTLSKVLQVVDDDDIINQYLENVKTIRMQYKQTEINERSTGLQKNLKRSNDDLFLEKTDEPIAKIKKLPTKKMVDEVLKMFEKKTEYYIGSKDSDNVDNLSCNKIIADKNAMRSEGPSLWTPQNSKEGTVETRIFFGDEYEKEIETLNEKPILPTLSPTMACFQSAVSPLPTSLAPFTVNKLINMHELNSIKELSPNLVKQAFQIAREKLLIPSNLKTYSASPSSDLPQSLDVSFVTTETNIAASTTISNQSSAAAVSTQTTIITDPSQFESTYPKPGKYNITEILSRFKPKQSPSFTTTTEEHTKKLITDQGMDSVEPVVSTSVRRSSRNAISNTQARIQQCQYDYSDEDSQGYDTEDSSYYPDKETINAEKRQKTEPTTSQQQLLREVQSSVLATPNMSPFVNITMFEDFTKSTTTSSSATNLTPSPLLSTTSRSTQLSLNELMKNNPGKVFIVDSSMEQSPSITHSSTMPNDLLTLSNIATQVRDRNVQLKSANRQTVSSSFTVPPPAVNEVVKVQLKNSKVVLRDCAAPKLEEIPQKTTRSTSGLDSYQEYQELARIFEASRILSNQQKSKKDKVPEVKLKDIKPELVKMEETPASKRQKKKKYWYPKKNEASSDQELTIDETREARNQQKRKPLGAYIERKFLFYPIVLNIYTTFDLAPCAGYKI